MTKINKHIKKIKVTEDDFKDFSKIASIPVNLSKSMVLYLTTWQEVPDDQQDIEIMTTKPDWFKEYEAKQDKHWEEQWKFNKSILGLVQKVIQRLDNLVIKNNLEE